jgi:phosphoribosyl 1,2-cyclic phosphodiesterase/FixJ family two-component response regulator
LRIRFWGTRGSIAKAGAGTVRYGGNTSCVEVRSAAGARLVLDCGTGAHGLGQAMVAERGRIRGHLLITHTHWDHIQGLPFFMPLFMPGNEWDVYGPRGLGQSLRETLAGQMQYAYFPVSIEQLGATIRYHDLVEGTFRIDDVTITTQYLNHTALTLGYRLESGGVALVYATDHEPHAKLAWAEGVVTGEERRHVEFLEDADLVIHDAQYLASEYAEKVGWGHSPVEYVVEAARRARVRRLALYHHDPMRDDDSMDRTVLSVRERLESAGARLSVFAAVEGQVVELVPAATGVPGPGGHDGARATTEPDALDQQSVLVAVGDPAFAAELAQGVRLDGVRVGTASDGETALRQALQDRPALLVVDRHLPVLDAFALARALRTQGGEYGKDVPLVVVADEATAAERAAGVDAGVTDWLVRPFSSVYARTRVRAWRLRTACRWQPALRPADEEQRLESLRRLGILDTAPEERFDRITRIAAALFDVPIALVSLVDVNRQWFKSAQGTTVRSTDRDAAFCAHAILGDDVLVVPDTLLDPRFADNPVVGGEPRIRFYAGYPLTLTDGSHVGTLCVMDHRPRDMDEQDRACLRDLAALAEREIRDSLAEKSAPAEKVAPA